MTMPKVSIIIPVLNEGSGIGELLQPLQRERLAGQIQVILVDGGSSDDTLAVAANLTDHALVSDKGRAKQMNAGAQVATSPVLLFLHADTQLPPHYVEKVMSGLGNEGVWGRFDVQLSGTRAMFRVIECMINWRSRLTGIATGDHAIFVRKAVFDQIGGFAEQPLMEDVELSRRLKKLRWPVCLRERVITSSRKWEKQGVWSTIFLMWQLRLQYYLGVPAEKLVKRYYP